MSMRYQTTSTTNYNSNDNKLDELLEDLQSTVASRPTMNGNATGYRETYKSVSSQKSGQPAQKSKEYQVEYLNPSNSTSIAHERPKSPFFEHENMNGTITNGKNASSYKTSSYEYSSSKRSGSQTATPVLERKSEAKFRKNINELDSLLDDLNNTQKMEFSSSSTTQSSRGKNFDSGFIEPLDSSTPKRSGHVSRIEEKSYEEQRYGNVNSSPVRHTEIKKEVFHNGEPVESFIDKYSSTNDFKKDLVFTGGSLRHREPSPARQLQQESYHYETKTSSTKKSNDAPRSIVEKYNFESDTTDNVVPLTNERYVSDSSYEYNRSPSPTRATQNYYEKTSTINTHRSPSPARSYYSSTSTVRNVTPPQPAPGSRVYSASKMVQETSKRETTTRSPILSHRSPSPELIMDGGNTTRTYDFERSVTNNVRSPSPSLKPHFSPPEPIRDDLPPGATIITRNYKYESHRTQNSRFPVDNNYRPEHPESPRPFPSVSPPLEIKEQKPPKQLDELMASFSDSETSYHREYFSNGNRSPVPIVEPVQCKTPPTPPVKTDEKLCEYKKEPTNGVAGPPVYYPPGPLFAKKNEECMVMEQNDGGKGKMNAKRKAKYKYEAGGKSKEKGDTKKTVVPLCLPVCCALPCTIM